MPTVVRSRSLAVEPDRAWRLIADPHNLPRWWPETVRVESVEGAPGARRSRFTQVFETKQGTPVRADYRITESTDRELLVWEQQIDGTPFAKFLRAAVLEFRIAAEGADRPLGSRITLEARRVLRGMSRLGSPMMRGATKRSLDSALDGIERALLGDPGNGRGGEAGA
jgi:uncharacterized protein YndB with AHSA1/START domain